MIRGSAGTGKTLLAAADAERMARAGTPVLLVCQSNALRDHLRTRVGEQTKVDVFAFQELCGQLIARAGMKDDRPQGSRSTEYFNVHRPTAAMEAWASIPDPPQWGAVVVDEAQDLLSGPASELLDLLIEGGWEDGRWRLFLDPVQDVFSASHSDVVERVSVPGFRVRLSVNCRNTGPIARDTAIATGTPLSDTLTVHGPEPTWLIYDDVRGHRKQLAQQLRAWLGFLSACVRRYARFCLLLAGRTVCSPKASRLGCRARLWMAQVLDRARHPRSVQFATVAALEGLEADAILLLDAPFLGQLDRASTLYVGMTRARALLSVLRQERFESQWERLQQEFGRRLVAEDATPQEHRHRRGAVTTSSLQHPAIQTLKVGQILRDRRNTKSAEPEIIDGLVNLYAATAYVGAKLAPFDAGINPIAAIASDDGPRRPAILIASSPHKSGSALTPWEDLFAPDDGYVRYFGDAKMPGHAAGAAPGNALLTAEFESRHGAKDRAGRLRAAPLVFFRRQAYAGKQKGYPRFQGFGLITAIHLITQHSEAVGGAFANLQFECAVLSMAAEGEIFDWSWVNARRDEHLSDEAALKKAPASWRTPVDNGVSELPEFVVRRVLRRSLTPTADQTPAPGKEEALLQAIYRALRR